jgi:hypothetical protein
VQEQQAWAGAAQEDCPESIGNVLQASRLARQCAVWQWQWAAGAGQDQDPVRPCGAWHREGVGLSLVTHIVAELLSRRRYISRSVFLCCLLRDPHTHCTLYTVHTLSLYSLISLPQCLLVLVPPPHPTRHTTVCALCSLSDGFTSLVSGAYLSCMRYATLAVSSFAFAVESRFLLAPMSLRFCTILLGPKREEINSLSRCVFLSPRSSILDPYSLFASAISVSRHGSLRDPIMKSAQGTMQSRQSEYYE